MMTQRLSVFLPVYNEEANLERCLEGLIAAISASDLYGYEVIIVNDGSTDSTALVANELETKYACTRVVEHDINKGYGSAIKTGILASKYEYIFFMDADLQFDPMQLRSFLKFVPEYDAVIGYRENRSDNMMRKLNAWLWNRLIRILFGLKVRDIDCAFKLIRKSVLDDSLPRSEGAMISAEMLIMISSKGYKIKELPVKHLPRKRGKSSGARLHVIAKAFKEMAKFWLDSRKSR